MSGPWWRSFLRGMGQILDLGGMLALKREDIGFHHDARDDVQAIRSDWEAVGRDFATVLGALPHTNRDIGPDMNRGRLS